MPTADELISSNTVAGLISCLRPLKVPTVRKAKESLDGLAFGERGRLIRDALLVDLPVEYGPFSAVMDSLLSKPGFSGWMVLPVVDAVALRATTSSRENDFDHGLSMMAAMTSRLSAEFAIRTFLESDLDRSLAMISTWTADPDEHVRRLASEGTRPYLPWGRRVPALTARPEATRGILNALYRDESEYVRRSVANHLNDLSRASPELVVQIATGWLDAPDANTQRVVRHSLRTLIKKGDPEALALLGFSSGLELSVTGPRVDLNTLAVGEVLEFEFTLVNTGSTSAAVAIDYLVHHVKANGATTAKVFKLATRNLAPGETVTMAKKHSFKPISTRRYYPGEHAIELQVNGKVFGRSVFQLTTSDESDSFKTGSAGPK